MDLENSKNMEVTHCFSSEDMPKRFGFFSSLGLSFAILNSWVAFAATLATSISLGGGVTVIWAGMAAAGCTALLSFGMGELASSYPVSGGPYHWTFVLAKRSRLFWSFLVGWLNVVSWWFIISSANILCAQFTMGFIKYFHSDYVEQKWHTYLIYVAFLALCLAVVIPLSGALHKITTTSLIYSVACFVICFITFLACSHDLPKQSGKAVFIEFHNESGWGDSTAWLVGFATTLFNYLGLDGVTHIAEEMPNKSRDLPRVMFCAVLIGFCTSFVIAIATFFVIQDLSQVSSDTLPILEAFYQVTRNKGAAFFLSLLILISVVFSVISNISVAGRMVWSFSRDNGFPFSEYFSHIDPTFKQPVRAIVLSTAFSMTYGAIYCGSSNALASMINSAILMLFFVYSVPQLMLLIHGRSQLHRGEFYLGSWGYLANIYTVVFTLFAGVFLSFPSSHPVEVSAMNYLSPVVVGVIVLVIIYYFTWKKGKYYGPSLTMNIMEGLSDDKIDDIETAKQ